MMSETVNAVVNNLSDRLSEIAEFVRPAFEAVNAVSVTVVQETSLAGFAYVFLGLAHSSWAYRLSFAQFEHRG